MKKWLALVVAALLVLSTMAAFAAVTPSKSTGDLAKIDTASIETSTGVAVDDSFVIAIPEEEPEKVTKAVEDLFDTTTKGDAPIKFFPEDVQEDIAGMLPTDTDLEELELNELIALTIENYDEAYGDIDIVFVFNTLYKPEQDLVAVLGNYTGDEDIEWTALEAEAQDDGSVKVTFTGDALKAAEEADGSMLGILNTK